MDEGVGRLAIKGPTGCRYLDDPRQRDYVVNGWNVTGDTYRRDADGYYWYLARSDDMIVSSGYNIGAPEVENALLSHPAVAECAVIGLPCPERGQKVKAFVVLAADAEPSDDWSRSSGSCEGADRALQISARNRVRGGAAEDRDGQAQAERVARTLDPAKAGSRWAMPRAQNNFGQHCHYRSRVDSLDAAYDLPLRACHSFICSSRGLSPARCHRMLRTDTSSWHRSAGKPRRQAFACPRWTRPTEIARCTPMRSSRFLPLAIVMRLKPACHLRQPSAPGPRPSPGHNATQTPR